MAVKLFCSNLY